MLLVIFLSKQQIFSPGLLTRLVLIMSVAEDGGGGEEDGRLGGGKSNYFPLLLFFAPNLFSLVCCLLSGQGGGFLCLWSLICRVWKEFIIWFIVNLFLIWLWQQQQPLVWRHKRCCIFLLYPIHRDWKLRLAVLLVFSPTSCCLNFEDSL